MRRRALIAACVALAAVHAFATGISPARAESSAIHAVRRGENLSSIAKRNQVTVRQLREWNGISGDRIYPGQELRVRPPEDATAGTSYVVRRGDTLSEIAQRFGTSVAGLRRDNGIRGSRIYAGQRLSIPGGPGRDPSVHVVRRGDTLSEIAVRYGTSVAALRRENGIRGSHIHPGQKLRVPGAGMPRLTTVPWDSMFADVGGMKRFDLPNGPYLGARPAADSQSSKGYREGSSIGPQEAHRRGTALLAAFDGVLDRLGRLGNELDGWHVVLDPGHGGEDPGAITPVRDGNGRRRYVVEDEYVYDVMLRVYALLRMHGATVTPTIVSPNHLVRRSGETFVHERNEVVHDEAWNRRGSRAWPPGGPASLSARVDVATRAFDGVRPERTLFLSLHADNDPDSPAAPLVLFQSGRTRTDGASRKLAVVMARHLGSRASTRGRNLHVLRHNPASLKVMVEVRNMAYDGEAWLLRNEEGRRDDARRIVDGVLAWATR